MHWMYAAIFSSQFMSSVVSPSRDRHKEEGSLHATHEQEFDSNRRRTGTACNGWRNDDVSRWCRQSKPLNSRISFPPHVLNHLFPVCLFICFSPSLSTMISLIRNATDVCRVAASNNLKIIQISTLILRPSRRRVLSVLGTRKNWRGSRMVHGGPGKPFCSTFHRAAGG